MNNKVAKLLDSCKQPSFLELVKAAHEHEDTRDITNYFVQNSRYKIINPTVELKDLIDDIFDLFTDSYVYPHCRLVDESSRKYTPVDFLFSPVDGEQLIQNVQYASAYCLIQIRDRSTQRCARILINKKNHSTALVVFLRDCVWDKKSDHILVQAEQVQSFILVLNLITAPTSGLIIQSFLADDRENVTEVANRPVASFIH